MNDGFLVGFVTKCASFGLTEDETKALLGKYASLSSVLGTGLAGAGLGAGVGMLQRKYGGPFEQTEANRALAEISKDMPEEERQKLIGLMSESGATPYSYGDAALRGATIGGLGGAASNLLWSGLTG
jgi:hypothetical protein